MSEQQVKHIARTVLRLMVEFAELDSRTHFYGTDVEIHPTEIHLISDIADNPGIHVMGLADMRNVTKGNVSQMVRKLEKKGLLEKRVSKTNQSKLSLYVTEKGQTAHENHMSYHAKLDQVFAKELEAYSENETEIIEYFLEKTLEHVKGLEESL